MYEYIVIDDLKLIYIIFTYFGMWLKYLRKTSLNVILYFWLGSFFRD